MSKKVYLNPDNTVREVIPEYALPVSKWYGESFASRCVDAPDDVLQGMVYDPETRTFSEPVEPATEPTTEEILLELAADHEYRLSLQEMGLSESDLL